nr:LysR substrate-binding domain-containing protein [Bradyrhizobium sp. KB893862 SZCCT0404]
MRADNSDALMQAAIEGLGIAHLATWLVGNEIASGRLVPLFADELALCPPPVSGIYAIRMRDRATARAKLFIDFLKEDFSSTIQDQVPYWDEWLSVARRRRPT